MPLTEKQFATIKRRLLRVAAKIIKHPELYNQENWCGTACCIAGHLAPKSNTWTAESEAKKLIFEDGYEDVWLFGTTYFDWPRDLAIAYNSAKTPAGRSRVGVRAINRYLRERRKEVVK